MQQLRSFGLPTPPRDVHDYGDLQDHLLRGINLRLLTFFLLSFASLLGFRHPPKPPPRSSPAPSPFSFPSLQIYFFFNTLALMSCVAGLLVSISHFLSASHSHGNSYVSLGLQRKRLAEGLSKTAGSVACLVFMCVFLAAAYPFAGITAAGESKSLRYAVVLPSIFGGVLLVKVLSLLIRHFFCWWASFMPDHHLWRAIQQDTVFGSFLARFL